MLNDRIGSVAINFQDVALGGIANALVLPESGHRTHVTAVRSTMQLKLELHRQLPNAGVYSRATDHTERRRCEA